MNIFENPIFIQSWGFLGAIIIAIGMQQKVYDRVVICKIGNSFCGGIQYLLLGGYTGMMLNLLSCGTNVVYWYRIKKNKSTLVFQVMFGIMFLVVGVLSWDSWISIFAIAAKIISTVSLGIKNTRVIRIMNLISTPCWLAYNIFMFSIGGMCSDLIMLTSLIIAVIRIDIMKLGENKK